MFRAIKIIQRPRKRGDVARRRVALMDTIVLKRSIKVIYSIRAGPNL